MTFIGKGARLDVSGVTGTTGAAHSGSEASLLDFQRRMASFAGSDFSEHALLGDGDGDGDRAPGQRDALGRHRKDESKKDHEDLTAHEPDAGQVLACVSGATCLPAPGSSIQAAPEPQSSPRVDEIMVRIEQAVRASLHGAGGPVSLSIRLDDLRIPGLNGLRLDMTPDRLDVTIARLGGVADAAVIAAAQELAQTLSVKYPTRVVRVLDQDPDRDGQPRTSGGLRILSDLLSGGRST